MWADICPIYPDEPQAQKNKKGFFFIQLLIHLNSSENIHHPFLLPETPLTFVSCLRSTAGSVSKFLSERLQKKKQNTNNKKKI